MKVDLPDAGAKPIDAEFLAETRAADRHASMHADGCTSISARIRIKPASEATISARTAALLRRDPQTPVLVKADTTVPYGTVVRAMVLLQQAGAAKVGFLTDPVKQPPRGAGNGAP